MQLSMFVKIFGENAYLFLLELDKDFLACFVLLLRGNVFVPSATCSKFPTKS